MKEQEQLPYEVAEHKATQREAMVYKVLRVSLDALSERGLRYLSLLSTIGMFAWASYNPDNIRTVNASLMATVFLFTLFRKYSPND